MPHTNVLTVNLQASSGVPRSYDGWVSALANPDFVSEDAVLEVCSDLELSVKQVALALDVSRQLHHANLGKAVEAWQKAKVAEPLIEWLRNARTAANPTSAPVDPTTVRPTTTQREKLAQVVRIVKEQAPEASFPGEDGDLPLLPELRRVALNRKPTRAAFSDVISLAIAVLEFDYGIEVPALGASTESDNGTPAQPSNSSAYEVDDEDDD